ncbi:MAG: DUF6869 domain-containing protein [Pseudomonadota bacterium]
MDAPLRLSSVAHTEREWRAELMGVQRNNFWHPSPSIGVLETLVDQWFLDQEVPENTESTLAIERVMDMTRDASPQTQLSFIRRAVEKAETDHQLAIIAAGPLEDLLSDHGPDVIDDVVAVSRQDPKFRRTMTGVWRQDMPDSVWQKIEKEQRACPEAQRLS